MKSGLSKKEYIEWLQRYIIIHSWIYYYGNDSLISDQEYDKRAKELVELQSEFQDIEQTQYGYVFYDFDGTTGFDLYDRLKEEDKKYLTRLAGHVMRLANEDQKSRRVK